MDDNIVLSHRGYPFLSGVNYESLVDGSGVRTVVFISGCPHHCFNCHNPETWNPWYGKLCDAKMIQEIAEEYAKRKDYLAGITLSGGDPLWDTEKTYWLLNDLEDAIYERTKQSHVNLWIYTGYTWEELMAREDTFLKSILNKTDVLVDGPFVQDLADKRLAFRGSSNQRILQVQELLK